MSEAKPGAGDTMKTVVVCGDVAVDWLDFPAAPESPFDTTGPNSHCQNWRLQPGTRRSPVGGGAILTTDMARTFMAGCAKVFGPALLGPEEGARNSGRIHSYLRVANFESKPEEKPPVWRVASFQGFEGPQAPPPGSEPFGLPGELPGVADLLVIDDAANGCRASEVLGSELNKYWTPGTRVILKMSRPVYLRYRESDPCDISCSRCRLWSWLRDKYIERRPEPAWHDLVVVLDADDLRIEECDISKGLSWERTATDTVTAFLCDEADHYSRFFADRDGRKVLACYVVIRFGLDGALLLPPGCDYAAAVGASPMDGGAATSSKAPRLIYDRAGIEGRFARGQRGKMTGYASAFTAALARAVVNCAGVDLDVLESGAKRGLAAGRSVLSLGFVAVADGAPPRYPLAEVHGRVSAPASTACFFSVAVPPLHSEFHRMPGGWSIVASKGLSGIEQVAAHILIGGTACCGAGVPLGQFGALSTLDKSEIESYRNIERLVLEYCDNKGKKEPLSIGVFGQPGAGKSFGVNQVIKSILGDVKKMTFNLSEFREPSQLSRAFHQVRDYTGQGAIPLVFFDEFDAQYGDLRCAWLKYFLAPMNDGVYSDGVDVHPLGRAILVFAGGTFASYRQLAEQANDPELIRAKVPDFISRLRGYIDILGVNAAHAMDYTCMLRRATVFHANLTDRSKALGDDSHWFISPDGKIRMHPGVQRAFLKVPQYRNSSRSMVAIMEMSGLSSSKGYTKAALPPPQLLDMQVDAGAFRALLQRDVIFLPSRDKLAERAHRNYLDAELRKTPPPAPTPNLVPWDKLAESTRDSNRQQVDAYLSYITLIGCHVELDFLVPPGLVHQLSDDGRPECDVERMAAKEHDRWCAEKRRAGWRHGARDDGLMFHPDLVAWRDLGEGERDKDRKAIRAIPALLATCRLVIVKCQ